ncbi:MAG: hypothetical protein A2Z16_13340 [Chloroflexi bacterium RBG_16_54_18]|nr:MAG: hypothetical protein A2Z16_13340 [Chloroflexi bacterium RBG_16_54_18]
MDIYLSDPSEIPLPPSEVRIRDLQVKTGSDRDRLHVYLEVDPFQRKPNLDITIYDLEGFEIAGTSIIESMVRKMEFTMLFRKKLVRGKYRLVSALFYVEIDQPDEGEGNIDRQVIDTREVFFSLD